MVVPVKKDGLYRCPGCGYIHLLPAEDKCPRCKEPLDWGVEKVDQAPIDRAALGKNVQIIVLVVAFLAVFYSMLMIPMVIVTPVLGTIAVLTGIVYLLAELIK